MNLVDELSQLLEADAVDTLYGPRAPGAAPSTAEAFSRIDRMIWDGNLIAGQRLVESDLCEQLQLSRGYVREALRLLAGDGVVELSPYRGASVRRFSFTDLAHIVEALIGLHLTGVDLLIKRRPPLSSKTKALLTRANKRIETALEDGDRLRLVTDTIDYHAIINHLTGNPYLNVLMARLHISLYHRETVRLIPLRIAQESMPIYRIAHKAILNGDASTARTALQRVFRYSSDFLEDSQIQSTDKTDKTKAGRSAKALPRRAKA